MQSRQEDLPRRAANVFIFITVMLDMLALGMIIPVLPKLVEAFTQGDSARAARVFGLFGTAWALMQFLFSPVLGALSDRFGRRPVILLSNLGLGLDYVLMALAPDLRWLFVGRVISGITAASISTSFAYIADITPADRRAASFGLVGAAFGLGFVIGPALGGVLGDMGPRLPFWVAAGFSLTNALYGLLVLPESLPPDRRAAFSWRRANPLASLVLLRSRAGLFGLALVNFLSQLAHVVLPSTFVLYASYRYGWNQKTMGMTLTGVGICSMAVQARLVGLAVRRLGERRTLLMGLGFGAVGFTVYGLAKTGIIFWCGVPLMSLWGLAGPATQGLMTRMAGETEQGRLQGATNSLAGIAQMISPSLFTLTFSRFIGPDQPWDLPGAPFLLAGALLGGAMMLGLRVAPRG